ncbi:MAG: hypothetical protein ACJ8F1_06100 [Polyangia bacterium]
MPPERPPSMLTRLRAAGVVPGLLLVLVACAALWWGNRFIPLHNWLFFRYLGIWALVALFAVSSWAAGLRLLSRLLPDPPHLGERLLWGFALGVLTFFAGIFAGGVVGLYGVVFFFAWPALLLAWGAPAAWRELRRARRHLRRFGFRLFLPRGPADAAGAVLLIVGCLAVYLQVLTPNNVGADSVWYHLPIAEHYVAAGAIRPFREGWYNGTLPQLASILYTWAFQAPGGLFEHMALSAHLEFALFVATLAGIAVLVRRLVGARAPFAGGLMFLFPGFLVYDSNLIIGADHVLAFWAPPLALAAIRWGRTFGRREAILTGLLTGAALLTKYHALLFLVPLSLWAVASAVRHRRVGPLLVWGGVAVAVWAPHWAKNWLFYADPFFPMLHRWLPSHPFPPGAAELMAEVLTPAQFRFTGTPGQKALALLQIPFNFAFVTHDWDFHGARPVFGSLFTCLLVALPFVRARLRLWLLVAAIHAGVLVWFVTAHEDRYLQALLPAMVACSGALLVLIWRRGAVARAAALLLVGSQAISGADVYFYRVHGMAGDNPLKAFVDFVSLAQGGHYDDQTRVWGDLQRNDLSKRVPKGSKLLAHHFTEKLGAGIPSVLDGKGWQGAIDYLTPLNPASTLALWRSLGITHVWWDQSLPGRDTDVMAREAVFQHAAATFVPRTELINHYQFGAIVPNAPPDAANAATRIAWIGCGGDPPTGLYTPQDFAQGRNAADVGLAARPALAGANVVLHRGPCAWPSSEVSDAVNMQFNQRVNVGDVVVFVRR